jgi:hypothetical protein
MTLTRHRLLFPSLALTLLALAAAALGLGFSGARPAFPLSPPATARQAITATDQIIWNYQ